MDPRAATVLALFLVAIHSTHGRDLVNPELPQTLVASLSPRLLIQTSPIRHVSSRNITGDASVTVSVATSSLQVSLAAKGTYPGQGGELDSMQPFNPLDNRGVSVSIYTQEGSSYSFALGLSGSWTRTNAANNEYQFKGTADIGELSSIFMNLSSQQLLLVLVIPPYPQLSDFVYVATGKLSKP